MNKFLALMIAVSGLASFIYCNIFSTETSQEQSIIFLIFGIYGLLNLEIIKTIEATRATLLLFSSEDFLKHLQNYQKEQKINAQKKEKI